MSHLQSSASNLLLRTLSPEDYALLAPHFELEELALRKVIYEPGKPIERVYFIEGASRPSSPGRKAATWSKSASLGTKACPVRP